MAAKKNPEAENSPAETVDLRDIQEQIAAMLAQAKAEAAKIVEEAKATAAGKSLGMSAEALAAHKAYMDEYVEVKLFRDNDKYKDDVFVAVNGENCVIKRGERVKIKRKFAAALEDSDKQDYEASKMMERKSDEFAKSGL